MADLFLAKKKLSEALEVRETEYWELMKKWYRGKVRLCDLFGIKNGCEITLPVTRFQRMILM